MLPDKIDTKCTTSGLLTATGAETVADTTAAIQYSINGRAYVYAADDDIATPTTDGNGNALSTLVANQGCAMIWCLDGSAVAVFQGDVVELDSAGNFETAPVFPAIDYSLFCPFAYQILKAGSTAGTITFGSSNWDATGFTNSIKNVHSLPARPQLS